MKYQDIYIRDILIDGRGVGETPDKVAFIEGAVYGEVCDIEIIEEKKNFYNAKKIKTIKESPVKTQAPCPYFYECGACTIMDIKYDQQLQIKKNLILQALGKSTSYKLDDIEIIPSKELRYRNKIRLQVEKDGRLAYNKSYSNDLVYIKDCLLAREEISENLTKIEAITKDISENFPGSIKEITIRSNSKDLMLNLDLENNKEPISYIKEKYKNSNFFINIVGKENINISGKDHLEYKIFDKTFRISANDFYQVNDSQIENLYGEAKKLLGRGKKVLDLYCGSATSSIAINDDRLVGVEINKNAIQDAKINAEINDLKDFKFIAKNAKYIDEKFIKKEKIDTLIVDPPRAGLDKDLIKSIGKSGLKEIIYISCNPQTLARDINRFEKQGYKLEKIKAVDMFPQTMHVETVVLMTRVAPTK
ncbi:23S rRNA (uracil(1939)-C(5))-methyltransferase RlmD [Anaerococcus degeneri]|uniref:23S rRNA (Uracil(1939)-C(5))-methyltransferase RlmD n=1 Tax=Anaerococcus degeneri TaxID=361500 RepID=A0ABS7YXC3_9FIRM|nr:23S rRNA (uracil(1939)-C(5))-methyltransferase RlmD [Anaerococcus degeneri]MBP2015856.1 23S rRNA (uracil1939-C5)-methyltransferase [Anaerococcus degeneri]MCA2095608.1 23S rRNA (uracil(1939)-C(5))-methyltransferase RlmD [Anaerococcus degeneri]